MTNSVACYDWQESLQANVVLTHTHIHTHEHFTVSAGLPTLVTKNHHGKPQRLPEHYFMANQQFQGTEGNRYATQPHQQNAYHRLPKTNFLSPSMKHI